MFDSVDPSAASSVPGPSGSECPSGLEQVAEIDFHSAARRIEGAVKRTPLTQLAGVDERVDLRLKLESVQETGSFKARGAWNQIVQIAEEDSQALVVATSSGNHGRALAWAARRAGMQATVFMPADTFANKIAACKELGAKVILCPTRAAAEIACANRVAEGAVLIHPFNDPRTIEGAGTVGLEIAADWPEVEVVIVPVGGGGLIAGTALALRQEIGEGVWILGAEPEGASTLGRALEAGVPVTLEDITTAVQGLCPLSVGQLNLTIISACVEGVVTLEDAEIFAAQATLVRAGHRVEPAGAAAVAAVLSDGLPDAVLAERSASNPLRVCCIVSGGNAEPDQLEGLL